MAIIKINDLTKKYGNTIAVDHMNLEIRRGDIFGLLGPNGAGKSTTINMICGLLKMDQGNIHIDGINIKDNPLEAKKYLGLVPQEIAFYDTLTAYENIAFFGKLSGLKGTLLKERTNEALEFVGLTEKARNYPKEFSGGMKRRLNIACSIVHHPKIIIMDEPTVGIDPQSRNNILESVKKLNQMGSTIVYTSHYMEEVENLCNQIAIMDHGRVIANGSKEELRKIVNDNEKIIIDCLNLNYNLVEDLKKLHGIKSVDTKDHLLEIIAQNVQSVLQDVFFIISKNNVQIREIQLTTPDLETVFLSLTGRKLRD
ncbi:ABC transporter ATP-binding protein [Vallitalea okinawensis]|uniref:ABC transporter ATP-binding protein n=1 Tax=Vallitalea okinawensis TaxID=2078660 RepID=UPI000CFDB908|nr:ABC transporter ATP-binding protein [Vallitalea okinawensis]